MLRHIPNVLTGLRLAAAPATAGLLTTGHFDAALSVFAFAGVSDAADGFLAKRFGLTSQLGRFLDPAADKALMLAAFLSLTLLGVVPLWLTVLIVAREGLMLLGILAAIAARVPITLRPLLIGKVGMALQVLYVAEHLASLAFGFDLGRIEPGDALVLSGFTFLSVFAYGWVWLAAVRALREGAAGH